MNYSRLQYFFWLIAGSEITVLKECKNDYNRHATAGALIFATCVIAAVIAGYAGYTYSNKSIPAAFIVALVWGYLIFCIDRFMVISLKKDPNIADQDQPFWKPLSIRLIFAFIIAFFMTIPLYHTFFNTQIETQISKDNINELNLQKQGLNNAFGKNELEATELLLTRRDSILNASLTGECPDPDYRDTVQLYNNAKNSELPKRKMELDNWQGKASAIWNRYFHNPCNTTMQKPTECYTANDWQVVNQKNAAKKAYDSKITEMNFLLSRANSIKNSYQNKIRSDISENNSLKKENGNSLKNANDTIQKLASGFNENLEKRHSDFVAQFIALWRAAFSDFGTFFLVIMLEAAFLMIEIFPTYQKLKTKTGDYDWAIYYKEKGFEEQLKSELAISKATEANRIAIETQLNKDLHVKIAACELKIAEETLAEWEAKARSQKELDILNASQKNN